MSAQLGIFDRDLTNWLDTQTLHERDFATHAYLMACQYSTDSLRALPEPEQGELMALAWDANCGPDDLCEAPADEIRLNEAIQSLLRLKHKCMKSEKDMDAYYTRRTEFVDLVERLSRSAIEQRVNDMLEKAHAWLTDGAP